MPWTKAQCPDGTITSFEDCLACDPGCMDIEVREAIFARNADQDPTHVGHNINVTSMLGCMRSTYLERTIDYAASPLSMWWTLRGELIHRLVERPDHDNPEIRRSELQLSAELDGITITGRVDNYKLRFLDYGVLKDWKSIGDNGLQYIIYDGAKEDHVWQTNIYSWLLRKNGYRVDTIEIAYLSLMQVVKTGTQAGFHEYLASPPAKTGRRRNMTGKPDLIKEYGSGKRKWHCTYAIPHVPLYDMETIENFIRPKARELHSAFTTGAIPGLPSAEVMNWKCDGYCNVQALCDQIERNSGHNKA
jgi:hypothetical protein